MNHAARLARAHGRIRSKFGQNEDEEQLYCWHNSTRVTCYQPGGTRARDIISQILVKNDSLTIHATKSEFTAVPVPGDSIQLGTALASARTLRIDSVRTTHIRPFYELELIDAKLATTAPAA